MSGDSTSAPALGENLFTFCHATFSIFFWQALFSYIVIKINVTECLARKTVCPKIFFIVRK
jgi:hypothetical protein